MVIMTLKLAQVTPESLDRFVRHSHESDFSNIQGIAQKHLASAPQQVPFSVLCGRKLSNLSHFVWEFLDMLITAVGFRVGTLPQAVEEQHGFQSRGERLLAQIGAVGIFITLMAPLVTLPVAAVVVSGTIVALWLLSLLYPHIRPPSRHLPGGDNWSLKYGRESYIRPLPKKGKQILNEMAERVVLGENILLSTDNRDDQLALGRAFARAVEQGHYPLLAGKQVIYFNTADFNMGGELRTKNILAIKRWIMGNKDRYIFLFDQLEKALLDTIAAEGQLVPHLDPGSTFPPVIGMTTEIKENFNKKSKNFSQKFQQLTAESDLAAIREEESRTALQHLAYETAIKVQHFWASTYEKKKLLLLHTALS